MRVFALFSLAATLLLAGPETGEVTAVTDEHIQARLANAQPGMSAITLRDYEGGEIITRQCVVTEASGDEATLRCEPFELFEQRALPNIRLSVEPGDRVILRPLGQSATVIAPSATRYVRVLDRFSEYRFVHPDLFAAQLRRSKTPVPEQKHMQRFCDRQMVGTLIFALKDGDYVVDCQSFATLAFRADAASQTSEPTLPFFNRLETIKRGFFSWGKPRKVDDFERHYRDFVTKDF